MSDLKKLMPLTDLSKIQLIDKKSGEVKIRYMKGVPRQYRFDASKGFFSVNGKDILTESFAPFTVIPIAYQIFTDDILGEQYKRMTWINIFFLNQSLHVCSLLLHGYSVENFMSKAGRLFYDNASFCDVKLTIKPVQKVSTSPEAKGAKYSMCFFDYKLIDKKHLAKITEATKGLEFYRRDIYTIFREIELSKNYGIPADIAKELKEIKAAKEEAAEKAKELPAEKVNEAKVLKVA